MTAVTPLRVAPPLPSKRPPPLPTSMKAATAPADEIFLEGVDGRADSLPSAEAHAPHHVSRGSLNEESDESRESRESFELDLPPMSPDDAWLEGAMDVEDPARTRRRKV